MWEITPSEIAPSFPWKAVFPRNKLKLCYPKINCPCELTLRPFNNLWARTHDGGDDDGGVAQHGGHTPNNRLTERHAALVYWVLLWYWISILWSTRREKSARQIWLTRWSKPLWRHGERSAQMHKIFENGVVASGLNNFFRRISPIILASSGVVFGSEGVITIILSWEVSRFWL